MAKVETPGICVAGLSKSGGVKAIRLQVENPQLENCISRSASHDPADRSSLLLNEVNGNKEDSPPSKAFPHSSTDTSSFGVHKSFRSSRRQYREPDCVVRQELQSSPRGKTRSQIVS